MVEGGGAKTDPGGQTTVRVRVSGPNGPLAGAAIEWSISGQGEVVSADQVTGPDGSAEIVLTSGEHGNTVVTAVARACAPGGACTATATVHWGPGSCDVFGTDDADEIVVSSPEAVVCGFGGDDTITAVLMTLRDDARAAARAAAASFTLLGGSGRDTITGETGPDALAGGRGGDTLAGRRGADILKGGRGPDTLKGGRGADTLRGGSGADDLRAGKGRDSCSPGPGRDATRGCEP